MKFQVTRATVIALLLGIANASTLEKMLGSQKLSALQSEFTFEGVTDGAVTTEGLSVVDSSTSGGMTEMPGIEMEEESELEPVPINTSPCNETFPRPQVYYDQRAVMYTGKDQQGEQFVIPQTNAPDLPQQNFDNRATSVCVTGIWLFYVEKNYNADPNAGMEYVFGPNNFCTNLRYVPGYVRSARSVGSPADYRSDTLTIFRDLYFQGDLEYTFTDLPKLTLENSHKSLIVTGSAAWTVYTGQNYQGGGICLYPPKSNDTSPYFLCDLNTADIAYGSIKSVRKGCSETPSCNDNDRAVHPA